MIDYEYKDAVTLQEAVANMYNLAAMLRSPEGCPWDRSEHPEDIAKNLMDEVWEYLDANTDGNIAGCREELGDTVWNAAMMLRMHEEAGDFSPIEAINEVCRKIYRRHPHVFSSAAKIDSPEEVLKLWDKIKVEKEGRAASEDDFFSKVPKNLPPLERAKEIQKKVRKVGFDWTDVDSVADKVKEELNEVIEASKEDNKDNLVMEVGDLLFAASCLAAKLKVNPMEALHRSNRKFEDRFNKLSELARERGIELKAENMELMDSLWNEVKKHE